MARAAVLATDPIAEEAAAEALMKGAGAVGAVIAGFFACAGARRGVLLGPAVLLCADATGAPRCHDGRLRQPGLGTKRPRGLLPGEAVPPAARLAVPAAPLALLTAHAYQGSPGGLGGLFSAGLAHAKAAQAAGRQGLLRRLRDAGARAFLEAGFLRSFLPLGAPPEGGLLTVEDLEGVAGVELATRLDRSETGEAAPWLLPSMSVEEPERPMDLRWTVVLAMTAQGATAALQFGECLEGLEVPGLDLVAPLQAVPVRRGVPRVAPGAALSVAPRIALGLTDGRVTAALGGQSPLTREPGPAVELRRASDGAVTARRLAPSRE